MVEEVVTTGVDALLDVLRDTDKMAMVDVAKELKVSLSVLQLWVDFLVEERILGIEYKFTKPYIYLNREKKKEIVLSTIPELGELRKEYFVHAEQKKIPQEQIEELWINHLHQQLAALEPYFTEQAQRRGVQDAKVIKELWSTYQRDIMRKAEEASHKHATKTVPTVTTST